MNINKAMPFLFDVTVIIGYRNSAPNDENIRPHFLKLLLMIKYRAIIGSKEPLFSNL